MAINKINVQRALEWVAEGDNADAHELHVTFENPTADRNIKFPDDDGTLGTKENATALAIALGG